MNKRMIAYLLGRMLTVEAVLMAPSAVLAAVYGEGDLRAFLVTMALLVLLGVPLSLRRPANSAIFAREGFVTVALAWVLMSGFGALPMVLSGAIPSYVDALFEMVSGFTTTGASILKEVESLPRGVLFWRSFSHWVGGMGVLVFVMAILPMSENRSMVLMRAEVPGPTASKLVPRMRDTAKILYGTYSVMTLALIVLLLLGGMPWFDAVCNAMGTAGTGGFSVRNVGIAYYNSPYIEVVLSIFMLLFAINFNLYYLILIRRVREALKSEELHWFLGIVTGAVLIITACVLPLYSGLGESLRHALFQVSSIISTTGFATVDFALWPVLAQEVLLVLMFVGACAGSTGGGFKASRVALSCKSLAAELHHLLHPRAVTTVRLDGKAVDHATITGTRNYLIGCVLILTAVTLLIAVDGFDFTTNFSAAMSCFNNIGPGLSVVGPMSNYSAYSPFSKLLLSLAMLAGRLEVFPIVLLFSPRTWRRSAS